MLVLDAGLGNSKFYMFFLAYTISYALYTHIYIYIVQLINCCVNLLKPTGYVMHQQFDIQQMYTLPTLYLFILYLSQNKQRLVPLTA